MQPMGSECRAKVDCKRRGRGGKEERREEPKRRVLQPPQAAKKQTWPHASVVEVSGHLSRTIAVQRRRHEGLNEEETRQRLSPFCLLFFSAAAFSARSNAHTAATAASTAAQVKNNARPADRHGGGRFSLRFRCFLHHSAILGLTRGKERGWRLCLDKVAVGADCLAEGPVQVQCDGVGRQPRCRRRRRRACRQPAQHPCLCWRKRRAFFSRLACGRQRRERERGRGRKTKAREEERGRRQERRERGKKKGTKEGTQSSSAAQVNRSTLIKCLHTGVMASSQPANTGLSTMSLQKTSSVCSRRRPPPAVPRRSRPIAPTAPAKWTRPPPSAFPTPVEAAGGRHGGLPRPTSCVARLPAVRSRWTSVRLTAPPHVARFSRRDHDRTF